MSALEEGYADQTGVRGFFARNFGMVLAIILVVAFALLAAGVAWYRLRPDLAVALSAMAVAISSVILASRQLRLTEAHVFGHLYTKPHIIDLRFFWPRKDVQEIAGYEEVPGFEQFEREERSLPMLFLLDRKKQEIHINWRMTETQTLTGIQVDFVGDFGDRPVIIDSPKRFVKKPLAPRPARTEYIDWWGNYHIEYNPPRRIPAGETFTIDLVVQAKKSGPFALGVSIHVAEAINSYRDYLYVECW